nr:heavy metal-responsive transcriptional regulator [Kibdelosporangium sp. MJ126-NF4]CEL17501.1 Mercuric resistance operon regulatory protein [Kibdelosporangium sp. MJ126-NF4]CTQ91272.1 Mercuric resistance operon regulatory protein [Kibdelosporangium sp. MJ126-NF4]
MTDHTLRDDNRETLRIGEVAAQAGVNTQTLRYYEREGLLPPPRRQRSGYRVYPPEAVQAVRFIKHAQGLGFTLGEIMVLRRWEDGTADHCAQVRDLTLRRIADTERAIARLQAVRGSLRQLVAECEPALSSDARCPLSRAIDDSTRWSMPLSQVECPHLPTASC